MERKTFLNLLNYKVENDCLLFEQVNEKIKKLESLFEKEVFTEMIVDKKILDNLSLQAKSSPRLRYNLDLRNNANDQSQRMLNAIEPGTMMPIHRHLNSSETCLCVRGHFEEYFYDDYGNIIQTIDMVPGGTIINIPIGQWHSLKSLESGTVLMEAKDGPWEPLKDEELFQK